MKRIVLLVALTTLSPLLAEESLLDLEQTLLSLEDELLNPEKLQTPKQLPLDELADPVAEESSLLTLEEETPVSTFESFPSADEELPTLFTPEAEEILQPVTSATASASSSIQISFKQVFDGSPWIYTLLLSLSLASMTISLYAYLKIREQETLLPRLAPKIRDALLNNRFEETEKLCDTNPSLLSRMIVSGLAGRDHGLQTILENMQSEGRRATLSSWQRLSFLQDIAVIAPMIGLLGTVVGLFYAFYDLNRSFDSISHLLDGLGISVGTTVAGICVAILAMILHSGAKFKLLRSLSRVEAEAFALAHLMDRKHRPFTGREE